MDLTPTIAFVQNGGPSSMGLREWAVKPGELRALSRGDLLLFGARCAMRVEPWRPKGVAAAFEEGLRAVVEHAVAGSAGGRDLVALARRIADAGAMACTRLEERDEPLGRCLNHATSTLATAVDAARFADRKDVMREILVAAKLSASIAAVWAHAGRVEARGDAVDVAATATWAAIEADVPLLAGRSVTLATARHPLKALRALGPLWPGERPSWADPPAR